MQNENINILISDEITKKGRRVRAKSVTDLSSPIAQICPRWGANTDSSPCQLWVDHHKKKGANSVYVEHKRGIICQIQITMNTM